ncbi:4'-phosphopantetheinyl transferase family protein [Actinomycetota bacterium Odt1-20B]
MGPLLAGTPVTVVETRADIPGADLFPGEAEVIAKSVAKRRGEFITVRHCARTALARIGVAPAAILPGERGAPGWPEGVAGSMTHCTGYRAAVVAPTSDVASVGIDAEPAEPISDPDVLRLVADDEERAALAALAAAHPEVPWDRLLFSAKESVYKTWFPLTRQWLDFDEAHLTFGLDGTFTARLLVPGPVVAGREITSFAGRWLVRDGIAVTAIVLPAAPTTPAS